MGAVTFSIDPKLIEALQGHLNFDVFVETGTFQGETVDNIRHYFNQIFSVELSKHYYDLALSKFNNDSGITLLNADSASALTTIMPTIQNRPVVFWLDAHWCVANDTAGESSQCPLLKELHAIKHLNNQSMIIIDDARLFLAAPQKPHEISNWPTLDAIVRSLFNLSTHHKISVVNDCILFFPEAIEEHIIQFASLHGIDWLDVVNRCRDTEVLLIKANQENERLTNLSIGQRIVDVFDNSYKILKSKLKNQIVSTPSANE